MGHKMVSDDFVAVFAFFAFCVRLELFLLALVQLNVAIVT